MRNQVKVSEAAGLAHFQHVVSWFGPINVFVAAGFGERRIPKVLGAGFCVANLHVVADPSAHLDVFVRVLD